jgi:DNA polymerase-3 subunit delta
MVSIEELEKDIKQNKLSSMYVFYGEELFLLESNVKKIKNIFGEYIKGINYIILDENNIEQIIDYIETPAFGYPKKLIISKNSGILAKEDKKKNEKMTKLREKLENYITQNKQLIDDSVILIFIESDIEKSSLFKTLDKNGVVCQFDFQKPAQIAGRLKAICNAYKVNIENSTIQYFIECAGTNMQELINEIRKLIEYAGENGTITKDSIDKLTIKQIESVIFDLTDSMGKKNSRKALEVLNNLLYAKEPIQKILITLYNHFKKLYLVKLAEKYNKDILEVLSLKPNQTFLVGKYKAQAKSFTISQLRKVLKDMADLDYKYKIGLIDINIGLETIICGIQ